MNFPLLKTAVVAAWILALSAVSASAQPVPSGVSIVLGDAGGLTYYGNGCAIGLFHGWIIEGTNAAGGTILNVSHPDGPPACGAPVLPLNFGSNTFSIIGQECGFNQFSLFDLPSVTSLRLFFNEFLDPNQPNQATFVDALTGNGYNNAGPVVSATINGRTVTLSGVKKSQLGFLRAGRYYADTRGDHGNVASCGNGWPLANWVTQFTVDVVSPDSTKPVITADAGGYVAGSWSANDVAVNFTCADEPGGSGLQTNTVAGGTVSATTALFTNSGQCIDNAGNVADPAGVGPINIDKIAPTVTYSGNAGTYTVDQTVSITCAAADTGGSGLASHTCSNISGSAYSFGLGAESASATASDVAGNTGGGSTSFTVVVDGNSLSNLIDQLGIDPSLAGSLKTQINSIVAAPNANAKNGKLNAFRNHVAAQVGKKLTAEQAALILSLAGSL